MAKDWRNTTPKSNIRTKMTDEAKKAARGVLHDALYTGGEQSLWNQHVFSLLNQLGFEVGLESDDLSAPLLEDMERKLLSKTQFSDFTHACSHYDASEGLRNCLKKIFKDYDIEKSADYDTVERFIEEKAPVFNAELQPALQQAVEAAGTSLGVVSSGPSNTRH